MPELDLAQREASLRRELATGSPAGSAVSPEQYLAAYRQGYLRESRSRLSGYSGRIVLGEQRAKHPLQLAYEHGARDSGKDRAWKWTAPYPIDMRNYNRLSTWSRRMNPPPPKRLR